MSRLIPLRVFDASDAPVLAVDTAGTVLYANRATCALFASAGDLVRGRHCWGMTRFRDMDGRAFCQRDCPIRRQALLGRMPAMAQVMLSAGRSAPRRFDLLNFLVPPGPGGGCLVLHFLLPGSAAMQGREANGSSSACEAPGRPWGVSHRLHLLSARELEVLEGLAGGLDAVGVADRLGISLNTARNHIRSIFRKLDVHRQMDAVLLLLGTASDTPERRGGPFASSGRLAS